MVIHIDEEKSRWGGILRDFVSRNTVAEAPELGADFKRNQLSISNGMGWRLAPEYTLKAQRLDTRHSPDNISAINRGGELSYPAERIRSFSSARKVSLAMLHLALLYGPLRALVEICLNLTHPHSSSDPAEGRELMKSAVNNWRSLQPAIYNTANR
jgi:hypothetical protein